MPELTVVIPVLNDAAGLKNTLESFKSSDGLGDQFEIIVVDNGSTDNTREVAKAFARSTDGGVRCLQEPIRSSYAARNRGILASAGRIIAFVDSDMSVPRAYAKALTRYFDSSSYDYLACQVDIVHEGRSTAALYDMIYGFPIETYLRRDHYAPTCCLAVRRTVFDQVGLFDLRLESGGDYEFGQRVFNAGLTQGYQDSIRLLHPPRTSIHALRNKSRRIGRGLAQLAQFHPERYSQIGRQFQRPRAFMPANPLQVRSAGKSRDLLITTSEAVAVAAIRPLLTFAKRAGFREENARLVALGAPTEVERD